MAIDTRQRIVEVVERLMSKDPRTSLQLELLARWVEGKGVSCDRDQLCEAVTQMIIEGKLKVVPHAISKPPHNDTFDIQWAAE